MKASAVVALAAVGAVAVIIGVLIGERARNPVKTDKGKFTLQVRFDGGYAFDFRDAYQVDVHSLKGAGYPMTVQVVTDPTAMPWDLHDSILSLLPDGQPPDDVKPYLPPTTSTQTGCGPNDPANPDNALFVPNLTLVAQQMGTTVKTALPAYATVRLKGGGALSVYTIGGCTEFRDPNGNRVGGDKRSMASGLAGIQYEWQDVPATSLTLKRTPFSGGTGDTMIVQPDANRLIILRVSGGTSEEWTDPSEHVITDFKNHFDDAFVNIDETKRISLVWLTVDASIASPGIDCPFGFVGP